MLFNYVHWTVSLFILYLYTRKGRSHEKKLFAWVAAFGIIVLAEGTLATGILPNSSFSVFARAAGASENLRLHNNTTDNLGKERIVFDEATNTFIQQFKQVFDTLLTEEQTFIDFSNITSLYALTGRTRPFYVGQSPSLLTDLYSQECFLNEIAEYDCPLAILGTTEEAFTQQMIEIPHNIRYYKIAEYIYQNYRPLVKTGDFVIWCEKDLYTEFTAALDDAAFPDMGYTLVDYGYDSTVLLPDEQGSLQASYQPYHQFALDMIPYIWANCDKYQAAENDVLARPENSSGDSYTFSGSQDVMGTDGNYMKFDCFNPLENNIVVTVTFQDSHTDGIRYEYSFTVLPGSNTYMIRTSQDYFWDVFNIDTIDFTSENGFEVSNLEILAGD